MNDSNKFFDVRERIHRLNRASNHVMEVSRGGGERVPRSGPRTADDLPPLSDLHQRVLERRRAAGKLVTQAAPAPLVVAYASEGIPSDSLETSPSNRNEVAEPLPFDGVIAVPCACRARTCERCGKKMGWRVRQNLLAKSAIFKTPGLLTLTLDRQRFESAEAAHRHVTDNGLIRRLMRLLGLTRWVWVLEFQTKTGEGWPHWHILVDLAECGGKIDLAKAWRLWRDKWGCGALDLQVKRGTSADHAVNYVTKYLSKMPEAFPTWVMLRKKVVRFIGASRAMGSLTGQRPRATDEPEPLEDGEQLDLKFRAPRSTLLFRVARCGQRTAIFAVSGDVGTGKGETSYLATVDASPLDLLELGEQGHISMRLAPIEWGEREVLALTDASVGGVVHAIRAFKSEVTGPYGHAEEWAERLDQRQWEIFDRFETYWQKRMAA